MNIFVSDSCPKLSAKNLDDKRVIKMVLESAQLLSTTLILNKISAPYKVTHVNHPAAVWVRQSRSNYLWLCDHFDALCEEYTNRYGKIHKCSQYSKYFRSMAIELIDNGLTPFANCTENKSKNISYKNVIDTIMAYKLYLNDRWDTDTRTPTWYGL